MARNCTICASPHADTVRTAVLAGETDQAIADRHGFTRAAMQRHRVNHIEAPARAMAKVASRGQDVARERRALAQATAEDPRVWLALNSITADLRKIHDRLDQAADAAAEKGQVMALNAVSGQLIRAAEVRAKLGGVGGEKEKAATFELKIFIGGEAPVVIEGGSHQAQDMQGHEGGRVDIAARR